jgi:hypothetical protein
MAGPGVREALGSEQTPSNSEGRANQAANHMIQEVIGRNLERKGVLQLAQSSKRYVADRVSGITARAAEVGKVVSP